MSPDHRALYVGSASLPTAPPLGVDLVGFLRRSRPSGSYGQPLEIGALVADDGEHCLAIIAIDLLATPGTFGRRLREAAADAIGCQPDAVLVNSSHTHAAPPPPGMLKLGGSTFDLRDGERRYADSLIDLAASAAQLARERLAPATLGHGAASCSLGVNRRQREPDGTTIVGWNPHGPVDNEVAVVRFDRPDGAPLATVVSYSCHPTVVGPESLAISADFVGSLRARVRDWTGGDCLFLQGCAGNVFPHEACFTAGGPDAVFGDTLAAAALDARHRADLGSRVAREARIQSAIPISIWRLDPVKDDSPPRLGSVERSITLEFSAVPSASELRDIESHLDERVRALRNGSADSDEFNPLRIHAEWARRRLAELEADGIPLAISLPLQALRLGPVGIVGLPCEPFCELGLEIKSRSRAPFPIVLGYSNDMVGYVPSAAEYQHGGYEVDLAHRHFGRPASVVPETDRLLVDAGADLLDALFQ